MATCKTCKTKYYSRECPKCNNNDIQEVPIKKEKKKDNRIYTKTIQSKTTQKKSYHFNLHNNQKHANFSIRMLANIIDSIIFIPLYFLNDYISQILIAIVIILLWVKWEGQSVGKKILNIKIVNHNYNEITTKTAIIRYIGYLISMFPIFIGYSIVAFRKDRQALHDMIAKTYVIHTDKEKDEYESETIDKSLAIISPFIITTIIAILAIAEYQKNQMNKMFYGTTNQKKIKTINKKLEKQNEKIMKQFRQMFIPQ